MGARGKLSIISNLGTALREWWELRVGVIAATEGEPSANATGELTQRLMGLRDAVRLALLQRIKPLSNQRTDAELQQVLQRAMGAVGVAFQALDAFMHPARRHCLRLSATPKCPVGACGRLLRRQADLSDKSAIIVVSASELAAAAGDCFGALDAKLNSPGRQATARLCPHCHMRGRCLEQPHTSVDADGAPSFILVELPDDPPRGLPYNLQPNCSPRPLVVGGVTHSSYQLVGMLMYSKGYHFFADVLDPCERRWLRYDGAVAGGVGQSIEPTGRAMRHGGRTYYPTIVMYVKVGEHAL